MSLEVAAKELARAAELAIELIDIERAEDLSVDVGRRAINARQACRREPSRSQPRDVGLTDPRIAYEAAPEG